MHAYFVRHGESVYNVLGLCNADPGIAVDLTTRGIAQSWAIAERLCGRKIDLIYASELLRAQATARIINQHHSVPILVDRRINDRKSGFEGKPVRDYLDAASADPLGFKANGGESYLEQKHRVFSFIENLKQLPVEGVLVVTHHEVLQIVNGYFKGLSEAQMWRTWIDNGQILEFHQETAK